MHEAAFARSFPNCALRNLRPYPPYLGLTQSHLLPQVNFRYHIHAKNQPPFGTLQFPNSAVQRILEGKQILHIAYEGDTSDPPQNCAKSALSLSPVLCLHTWACCIPSACSTLNKETPRSINLDAFAFISSLPSMHVLLLFPILKYPRHEILERSSYMNALLRNMHHVPSQKIFSQLAIPHIVLRLMSAM